ncbi:hypothetical protein ACHAW6_009798 [Cyclotella cf. meneghiniana]
MATMHQCNYLHFHCGESHLHLQFEYPHHWAIKYRDKKPCATLCTCRMRCLLMSVQFIKIFIRISINLEQSRGFQYKNLVSCCLQIPTNPLQCLLVREPRIEHVLNTTIYSMSNVRSRMTSQIPNHTCIAERCLCRFIFLVMSQQHCFSWCSLWNCHLRIQSKSLHNSIHQSCLLHLNVAIFCLGHFDAKKPCSMVLLFEKQTLFTQLVPKLINVSLISCPEQYLLTKAIAMTRSTTNKQGSSLTFSFQWPSLPWSGTSKRP